VYTELGVLGLNPFVNIIKVWNEKPPKDFKFHSDFIVEDNALEYVFVQQKT